jgi:hypothetical protein
MGDYRGSRSNRRCELGPARASYARLCCAASVPSAKCRYLGLAGHPAVLLKVRQDLLLAQVEQRKTEMDGFNIEALLSFAEHLLTNAAEMWLKADLGQRKSLQDVLFPAGITYRDGKFGTSVTCPLFNVLRQTECEIGQLASPRGFEPRFSP